MLADAAIPPIDKTCGEGLMPDSLAALSRLGMHPDGIESSYRFRGIRFVSGAARVDASFPQGLGIGVRRTLLHQMMVDRAANAGVEMIWGACVAGIDGERVRLGGGAINTRWIVGADGQNSRVRTWANLDDCERESRRYGFRRHYRVAPWTDCMEIYWGSGCQVYVTPVSAEEVCVALISRNAQLRLDTAMAGFPELAGRLEGASSTSTERGAVSATRSLRRVAKGNVALVGDASGSVDAITGEGLCLSFQQAMRLADALASGKIEDYQSAHPDFMRRPAMMAEMMLLLDRFSWLRHKVVPAMAARPAVFAKMLAMHVGEISRPQFVRDAILPLGWQMLRT
jgi:flavin-dependent dehydrogenase